MTIGPISLALPCLTCGLPLTNFPRTMHTRLAVLCLLVVGTDAFAADSTTSPTSTAPAKPVAHQVIAPKVSETRVVVRPDGSLGYICNDRANPKATALIQKARAASTLPDQEP